MIQDTDILIGQLEDEWCSLEQLALACRVEPAWLKRCLDDEALPQIRSGRSGWQLSGSALLRTRRMYLLERDFEANLELAALVADMLEEMDSLRARLASLDRSFN